MDKHNITRYACVSPVLAGGSGLKLVGYLLAWHGLQVSPVLAGGSGLKLTVLPGVGDGPGFLPS